MSRSQPAGFSCERKCVSLMQAGIRVQLLKPVCSHRKQGSQWVALTLRSSDSRRNKKNNLRLRNLTVGSIRVMALY